MAKVIAPVFATFLFLVACDAGAAQSEQASGLRDRFVDTLAGQWALSAISEANPPWDRAARMEQMMELVMSGQGRTSEQRLARYLEMVGSVATLERMPDEKVMLSDLAFTTMCQARLSDEAMRLRLGLIAAQQSACSDRRIAALHRLVLVPVVPVIVPVTPYLSSVENGVENGERGRIFICHLPGVPFTDSTRSAPRPRGVL